MLSHHTAKHPNTSEEEAKRLNELFSSKDFQNLFSEYLKLFDTYNKYKLHQIYLDENFKQLFAEYLKSFEIDTNLYNDNKLSDGLKTYTTQLEQYEGEILKQIKTALINNNNTFSHLQKEVLQPNDHSIFFQRLNILCLLYRNTPMTFGNFKKLKGIEKECIVTKEIINPIPLPPYLCINEKGLYFCKSKRPLKLIYAFQTPIREI